ncbi:glycosyltransferase family 4 protein [Geothrix oryzisoli]|uniref:glycosyltransferase family 4 protein n=1 Tax=Geothrix oryzisoli TaxID=2922721 RepID=UPI001FACA9A4|nr:glycosyltransferase family 4 protein [Geothrix oryzisoli]
MKIAYVVTKSDPIGGAQIHVRDLATYMNSKGHEVHVVVGDEGMFSHQLMTRGINVHTLKSLQREIDPIRDIRCVIEMHKLFKAIRPQIISTHSSKAGWVGRIAARMNDIPVLFTAHGWAFTDGVPAISKAIYLTAEKLVAPLATHILTVSENDRQLAIKYSVCDPSKVTTVHNGMPTIDASMIADPTKIVPKIVMTARFDEPKDHSLLFEALAGLKDLEWTLDLIGHGSRIEQAKARVAELGISNRVRFWGTRDDIDEILSRCQIFVLPTKWEGFPRSILEAMRAGLPVVASNVGGVREAVLDGNTGWLVARGDIRGWTSALRALIESPDLRSRMGMKGKALFDREFTFECMLTKTLLIYRNIAKRSGGQ